jgi:heptosyltransferase-2
MQSDDNIFELLREKGAEAASKAQRGLILQPGAIGDCLLTLPLVRFMKDSLGLGGVDILGHTEYIGILPGRSCADGIRSMDSVELHKLFAEAKTFDLADGDPLIDVFAGYPWIVSFMGEPDSDFEQNLIFTANCSHSAEVITLPLESPQDFPEHISDFYIQQFISQSGLSLEPRRSQLEDVLIRASEADVRRGKEMLKEMDLECSARVAAIHPGGGGVRKCWHLNNFLAVAQALGRQGVEVIFLLGPAELERFSEGTIKSMGGVGKCLMDVSLSEVLELLSCADMFLGNDSGITHLAAGLGVRTLAVFGPTDPGVYKPLGPEVTVFAHSTRTFSKKPSLKLQRKVLEALET